MSRRWRTPWRSYPFVELNFWEFNRRGEVDENSSTAAMARLLKFGEATMDRFSRDKLLSMKTLKVTLEIDGSTIYSPVVNQLLNLAAERKAEEIAIIVTSIRYSDRGRLGLPFGLLSSSSVKSLRLRGISFTRDRLPLSLSSLRFVKLDYVDFEDDQLLVNLIASSPLLETLTLNHITKLRKLQVCNVTNLKTLKVSYCNSLEEIEISAAGLQTLHLEGLDEVSIIELIAPQLTVLEFVHFESNVGDISALISKHKSLKSLTLVGCDRLEKKLKLSNPNLEEFTLWATSELEEIEFDSMPCLAKFFLYCNHPLANELKISEVGSIAADTDEWKVDFSIGIDIYTNQFAALKNFISRFTQFRTVYVRCFSMVTFEEELVVHDVHPRAIEHLKIELELQPGINLRALLDGLFWACRPRFLTMVHGLSEVFLNLTLQYSLKSSSKDSGEGFNGHRSWLHQLKDVKMVMRYNKPRVRRRQECACFELTWY
ncbi:F-box/LRR-repeat protein 13 [Linum perenne]